MTNPRFTIEPVHESHGEGNGWYVCQRSEATLFEIWDAKAGPPGYDGMLVDAASTYEAAERLIREFEEAA